MSDARECAACKAPGGRDGCGFRTYKHGNGGTRATCRACESAANAARTRAARERRRASDYAALKPEDFEVGVAHDGRKDPGHAAARRQEYSEQMGEFAEALADSGGDPADVPPECGTFVGRLLEEERRFGNRRLARSVSLATAHELLNVQMFKKAAAQVLGPAAPSGYALKPHDADIERTVCLLLSDLHFGSELSGRDEPRQYGAVEEARRFEYVVRQALDYKPQYRERSELLVLLDGDLIDGQLGHDLRSGAPLAEQKVAFLSYARAAVQLFSSAYPRVRVACQVGNHGRDKVRHPGRATARKWDSHEWEMYWALAQMCEPLRNVAFDLPLYGFSVVDLYGAKLLLSHGDTEVPLAHPDRGARDNGLAIDRVNASKIYCDQPFAVAAFGHYHTPRLHPRQPTTMIFNGCLVPPSGWYRSKGFIGEKCGQFLWEAVAGHPVGDVRFVEVGEAQDADARLGELIRPCRLPDGGRPTVFTGGRYDRRPERAPAPGGAVDAGGGGTG